MEERPKIIDCIQLIKKLPINQLDENIVAISNLIYEEDDLLNEFLQKVDNRTEISTEDSTGDFIKCEQNREGDSYRSPNSNKYFPAMEGGRYPSQELRNLEVKLNKIFAHYARSYYSPTAICSCYCWEIGDTIEEGFEVGVIIKNKVNLEKEIDSGIWDSSNIVNVTFIKEDGDKLKAVYKLTTSVSLQMYFDHKTCGKINLSGTVSRQVNNI
jgi:capping protein beta